MTSRQPGARAGGLASSARSRSSHSYCACNARPSTLLSSAISRQPSVNTRVYAMKPAFVRRVDTEVLEEVAGARRARNRDCRERPAWPHGAGPTSARSRRPAPLRRRADTPCRPDRAPAHRPAPAATFAQPSSLQVHGDCSRRCHRPRRPAGPSPELRRRSRSSVDVSCRRTRRTASCCDEHGSDRGRMLERASSSGA